MRYWLYRSADRLVACAGRQPRLLSNIVAREKNRLYADSELHDGGRGWRPTALRSTPRSWVAVSAVVLIGLVFGRWVFPPGSMSMGAAAAIIGTCIQLVIGVVALIIPLLILVIEFYGREAGVSDLIIRRAGLKEHLSLVLAFVVLLVFAHSRGAAYQNEFPSWLVCGAVLGTAAIGAQTMWFARRTILSLRTDAVYEALEGELTEQVRLGVDDEMDHRLIRLALETLTRQLGVVVSPAARYTGRQKQALVAHSPGFVVDVRVDKLNAFAQALTSTIGGTQVKAYLTRSVHDRLREAQPMAYVSEGEKDVQRLTTLLTDALIVTPSLPATADIKGSLEHLRDLTIRAIEESSERRFVALLRLYDHAAAVVNAAAALMGGGTPPRSRPLDLFAEWRAVELLRADLWRVSDHAARNDSTVFLRHISTHLSGVALDALAADNPAMFRLATRLFTSMYVQCDAAHNERGKELVLDGLTGQLVAFGLVPLLKETAPELESAQKAKTYVDIVVGAITEVTKLSIDLRDPKFFDKMVRGSEELLTYYHPSQALSHQLYEVLATLRQSAPGTADHDRALQKQGAVEFLINLGRDHEREWSEAVFVLGGYVVNECDRGRLDEELSREFMNVVMHRFPDLRRLFAAFSAAISEEYHWTLFDDMPDTKRVTIVDSQRKYYLFYALAGMRELRFADLPEEPFTSESLGRHDLERLRASCEAVLSQSARWEWFTGKPIRKAASDFVSFHEQVVAAKEHRHEESLIQAPLSPKTVHLFEARARDAAEQQSAMRYWLQRYDALSEVDEVQAEDCERIVRSAWEDKATFVEDERSDVAAQLGRFLGEALASDLDNHVLGQLLGSAEHDARPRAMALADAMTAARQWLGEAGPSAGLLVVPVERNFIGLHSLPGFTYPEGVDHDHPTHALHGFYHGIPVLTAQHDALKQLVLAIHLAEACRVEVTRPLAEVRTLTDQEIDTLTEKDPTVTDWILRLRVWVKAWQYVRLKSIDEHRLWKVGLKPTD